MLLAKKMTLSKSGLNVPRERPPGGRPQQRWKHKERFQGSENKRKQAFLLAMTDELEAMPVLYAFAQIVGQNVC
jgi:predicted ArsR family transcriptional regulator